MRSFHVLWFRCKTCSKSNLHPRGVCAQMTWEIRQGLSAATAADANYLTEMLVWFLGLHLEAAVWKKQQPNYVAACSWGCAKCFPSASGDGWDKKTSECFVLSNHLSSGLWKMAISVPWLLGSGGQVWWRWALWVAHSWQEGKPGWPFFSRGTD